MKKNGSSKKEAFKSFFLPLIVLVAICAVIGSAMAAINLITAPKIEEAQAQKKQEALSAVVPDNKGFEKLSISNLPERVTEVYADKGSASLALMLSVKGYDSSKPMSVAVGFDENGEIIKISVISCSGETKGIGSKVSGEEFLTQFLGKSDASAVDTVSGATISSGAFIDGINDACRVVKEYRATEVTK